MKKKENQINRKKGFYPKSERKETSSDWNCKFNLITREKSNEWDKEKNKKNKFVCCGVKLRVKQEEFPRSLVMKYD